MVMLLWEAGLGNYEVCRKTGEKVKNAAKIDNFIRR